jgi:hypothetical protein
MIELHPRKLIRGHWRAEHVKIDEAGKRALAEFSLGPHEVLAGSATFTLSQRITGIDVYLNECPCDELAHQNGENQ